jgi:hypothetical protein
MPYALLASLVVSVLCARFLLSAGASARTKACVGVAWMASLVLAYAMPHWAIAGTLLQVMLGIGLLLHERLHARDRRQP